MRTKEETLKKYALLRMEKFGLKEWRFEWDRAKQRFGCCHYGPRMISISRPLLEVNSLPVLMNTVNHEIAHALAGFKAHHGPAWKAMCLKTGAKPERCNHEGMTVGKYVGICSKCPYLFHRQKMPKRGGKHTGCGGNVSFKLKM